MIKVCGQASIFIALAAVCATAGFAQASGAEPAPAAAAAGSQDDAAKQSFEVVCSGCHELSQATSQHKDLAGWTDTVERMVGYGAPVTAEDQEKIVNYLAATYPATAP